MVLVGLTSGCAKQRPEVEPPGAWRVIAVKPIGGEVPEIVIDLDGDAGFARATLAVERSEPIAAAKAIIPLYDILFPITNQVRLIAVVKAAVDSPSVVRVEIRAESGSESSVSFVEPRVRFLALGAQVQFESLCEPNRIIQEGQEVALARWVVKVGPETDLVTIRVLLSKKPTSPRLRPEGKPPV